MISNWLFEGVGLIFAGIEKIWKRLGILGIPVIMLLCYWLIPLTFIAYAVASVESVAVMLGEYTAGSSIADAAGSVGAEWVLNPLHVWEFANTLLPFDTAIAGGLFYLQVVWTLSVYQMFKNWFPGVAT